MSVPVQPKHSSIEVLQITKYRAAGISVHRSVAKTALYSSHQKHVK